jgi:VanZ family protein
MRPAYWLPAVGWMAVILVLSSDVGGAQHTGRVLGPLFRWLWPGASSAQIDALHFLIRKTGHFIEYAILAALWYRAFFRGRRLAPGSSAGGALAISVGLACLDELHQAMLTVNRGGSPGDVALDTAGAVIALLVVAPAWTRAFEITVSALLGIAAVGGVLALVVNAFAGVPSGLLWLTTPLAALLLILRVLRRWRRRRAMPAADTPDPR